MADEADSSKKVAKQTIRIRPMAPAPSAGGALPSPPSPQPAPDATQAVKPVVAPKPAPQPAPDATQAVKPVVAPKPAPQPAPGATQAVKPVVQQPAAAGVKEMARRTIKLVPPVRTGLHKTPIAPPSPAPVLTPPEPVSPKNIVTPDAPTVNMTKPEDQETEKHMNITRRTIRIAPPVSGLPEPAAPGKVPTLEVAPPMTPGAKRTQSVSSPFLKTNGPTSSKVPTLEEVPAGMAGMISSKVPTLEAAPPTQTEAAKLQKSDAAPDARTINLVGIAPVAPNAKTIGIPTQEAAPSANTIEVPQEVAPSAKTITLSENENKPQESQEKAPEAETPETPAEEGEKPPVPPEFTPEMYDSSAEAENSAEEPGKVFTGIAAAALVVLLVSIYVLVAQYGQIWLKDFPNLPLFGLK